MNPEEICEKLGLQAWYEWIAGTQRKTPKNIILLEPMQDTNTVYHRK